MTDLDPPIEALFGPPRVDDLPEELAEMYGSGLDLPHTVVYANFVTSIDGIVAIGDRPASSSLIGGGDRGDRFVMALLRAAADVVLIGAGTFRQHRGPWTAAASFPDAEWPFAELRARDGRSPQPTLAVVTASGQVEPRVGSARQPTIVLTTEEGAEALPPHDFAEVVVIGAEALAGAGIVDALRERGFARVLTEGGPRLMAQLVAADVVDELFLTVSPILAGGGRPGDRSTLVPRIDLLPDAPLGAVIRSARRRGSFLFLRYGVHERPAA